MSRRNIFYDQITHHLDFSTITYPEQQKETQRKISQSCSFISKFKKEQNQEYGSLSSSKQKRKFEKFKDFCKDLQRKDVNSNLFQSPNPATSQSTINSHNLPNLFTNSPITSNHKLTGSLTHRKKSSKLSISPENKNKEDFDVEEILFTLFNKHNQGNQSGEIKRKNSFTQLKFKKKDDGKTYNFQDGNFCRQKTNDKNNNLSTNMKNKSFINHEFSNTQNICQIKQKFNQQNLQKQTPSQKQQQPNQTNLQKNETTKKKLKKITQHSFQQIQDKNKNQPKTFTLQQSICQFINLPCQTCSKKQHIIHQLQTNMKSQISFLQSTLQNLRHSIQLEKQMLIEIFSQIQYQIWMKIKQFSTNMQIQKAQQTQFIFAINSELNQENQTKQQQIKELTKQIQKLSFQNIPQTKKQSQQVQVQTFEIILISKELIHQHTQTNYLQTFNKQTQSLFDHSRNSNQKDHSNQKHFIHKQTQCFYQDNYGKEIQKYTSTQPQNSHNTMQSKGIGGIVNSILQQENQKRISDFSPKVPIQNNHQPNTTNSVKKKQTYNSQLNPNLNQIHSSKDTSNYYSSPVKNYKYQNKNNTNQKYIFENQIENQNQTKTRNDEFPKRFEISNFRKNRAKSEHERIENKQYDSGASSLGKEKFKNCYGSIQGIISKMKLNYT